VGFLAYLTTLSFLRTLNEETIVINWKGWGRKRSETISRNCLRIYLKWLRKTTKISVGLAGLRIEYHVSQIGAVSHPTQRFSVRLCCMYVVRYVVFCTGVKLGVSN